MAAKIAMVRNRNMIDAFDRGGGVMTRLFCNGGICGAKVTTGTTTIPVGRSVALHPHNRDEQIEILADRAEARLNENRHPTGAMEVAFVPADEVHCFHNLGDEPVLMLFIDDTAEVTRAFPATCEAVMQLGAGERARPGT